MRKIIASLNMSIDGYCDHTGMLPDEELHDHFTELLKTGDLILYGRKTYELMQFWQDLLANPTGEKAMDDFAKAIDQVPKLVFSSTLENTGWDSAELATTSLAESARTLRQEEGRDVFVGSRSLIIQLLNEGLLDELQLCIHPVAVGQGLALFEGLKDRTVFRLEKTKTMRSGIIVLYYAVRSA